MQRQLEKQRKPQRDGQFASNRFATHQHSIAARSSVKSLELLGTVRLIDIESTTIRGRKRYMLLGYLLEARIAGRAQVGKLELISLLHPGVPHDRALNALRVEVHGLRSNISPDLICTTSQGYCLGHVQTDAETFLKTRNTQLWRGAYLEAMGFEREDASGYQYLTTALHHSAQKLINSNLHEATRVMRFLTEMEPFDLEFSRTYLHCLRAMNNHRALDKTYRRLQNRVLEVGEVLPKTCDEFLNGVQIG